MEGDNNKKQYDLEERTAKFAENIINFAKTIPINEITKNLILQIIKSGTSQAANYYEANEAESTKDFTHKVNISKKEVKETKLWLRLIANAYEPARERSRILWQEAHELNLIFAKIIKTSKSKLKTEN
ncbi:MAG: four helix bundle protein [Candidatus Magasanikiibacteriota bacterium]